MSAAIELPIDALAADPTNPRTMSDEALAGLSTSTRTFGDISSIVFNARTGQLVCGHQRVRALRDAGAAHWVRDDQGGYIQDPRTGERFPVRLVDWDETTQQMANLVANNPGIQGEFTAEALGQLEALKQEVEFAALGLGALHDRIARDLDELVRAQDLPAPGLVDPDSIPAAEARTQAGDLWILGEHRLVCGDSADPEVVARLMHGARAALVATDPPYGVDYVGTKSSIPVPGLAGLKAKFGDMANDQLDGPSLRRLVANVLAQAALHATDNAAYYVWHPSGELNHHFRLALDDAGILIHRQIIWVKPHFVLSRTGYYHWQHETCFFGWRRRHMPPFYGERNQSTVWNAGRDDDAGQHPTQKPVALFHRPIGNHTRPGDVCFEPFSGSGSQIIAGEQMGRKVYAIELSPRYCDVAVARWEAFTGRQAEKEI